MSTKLVSEWKMPSKEVKSLNLTFEDVCDQFIKNDISLFLHDEKSNKKSGAFFKLLHSEYKKVEEELNCERWLELSNDIYFDKKAGGCWVIKDGNSDKRITDEENNEAVASEFLDVFKGLIGSLKTGDIYRNYNSSTPLSMVNDFLNMELQDPINRWEISSKEELMCLTGLSENQPFGVNDLSNMKLQYPINRWEISSKEELVPLDELSGNEPFGLNYCCPIFFGNHYVLYAQQNTVKGFYCHSRHLSDKGTGFSIPFLKLAKKNSSPQQLFLELIHKGLTPKILKNSSDYQLLLTIFHRKNEVFKKSSRKTAQLKLTEDFLQKESHTTQKNTVMALLLTEDHIRAGIAPYHQKILEDTELGHWSLWPSEQKNSAAHTIELANPLVALDPKSSINNGVVGIDFGTTSTVVVYQKDNVNIHPMRIGTDDLSKELDTSRYENPTIMEFNDLERFITDYQSKANKPYTRWQDLTISHTAQNSMDGCPSSQFNTFLDEIKQWAGDKNRKLKIVGKQGKVIDLPPFLEIGEDDFNPIELYAYYLGLYINNQYNGIYLNYILSFPVTYELPIRDKIIESFNKGIQKSLPAELGGETLAKLKVSKGASEPAAYALVALKAFEFDPCDDQRIFYSVFDFGGGTTDFDFGIFREANGAKERRYDHVIEHFGAGGDRYLGGENLLELLAFEIFKKNKNKLLENSIQFEKHPEKDAFAGSEQLLSSSQEAKINTKSLCRALRPFWEGQAEGALDLSQGVISFALTDMDGTNALIDLDIDEDTLNKILHDRIERGVINFFEALRLAFSHSKTSLQDIDSIKIFLAGNSSQSHFVKEIFDKQIALQLEEMGRNSNETSLFELFSPLGADKDDVEKPTGKTGVAFGLIETRAGGRIKVIDNNLLQDDIRFKFYLGENRKGKFKAVINREQSYQQWVEYIDASEADFEFFYTDQPNASSGKMAIDDSALKKTMVELDITDDEAMVYLRIVSPTQIEYVVAHEENIAQEQYLNEIKSIELSL